MPEQRRASITTILFTDLVNSTELMQKVGDERAQELFRTHYELLAEAVSATGGEELQWMGDGLMVAFASPGDAVRCAVAMQQAARQAVSGHELEIRVGLNVGEVLTQQEGSGYFGTPVVIAKRLCDRALSGQILCSSTLAGLLTGRQAFDFEELGAAELKGLGEPVSIAEVRYEAERASPLLRQAPFVGRSGEMERLLAHLDRAKNGQGGVLMVVGEPGIGKTRTLEEFSGAAREGGAAVLWGRCFEGEWTRPFAPFAEAVNDYTQEADPTELAEDLGPYGAAVATLAPILRERLPDLPPAADLSPDEERYRLLDAVCQFLLKTSARAPLVLVLDDLHWADRGTIAMLRHLAHFAGRGSLLLIGAYRDVELDRNHPLADALAALRRDAEYERILLRGLAASAVTELLETLASQEVPGALTEAILRETEGNPFFIREVVLHLVEEGRLYRSEGRWKSDVSIAELGIPEGVRQVIGRRLSRLSDEANRLLAAASGTGGSFHLDVAAAAAGLEELPALDALDEALEAQLLRPSGAPDAYDFTHALIRHTLYGEMNPSRQVRLHRRLAEAMERVYGARTHEFAAEIARQYQHSAALPGAEGGVVHCLAAADRARSSAAFEEEVTFLRMALELLPESDERAARLRGRLGVALGWSVAAEEALEVASDAGAGIAVSEGEEAAADYLAEATNALWSACMSPLAWQLAEQGMRHVGERRDDTWITLRIHQLTSRDVADPVQLGVPTDSPERHELSDAILCSGNDEWLSNNWRPNCLTPRSRDDVIARFSQSPVMMALQGGLYAQYVEQMSEDIERRLAAGELAGAALWLAILARAYADTGDLAACELTHQRALEISARIPPIPYLSLQLQGVRMDVTMVRGDDLARQLPFAEALLKAADTENRWALSIVQIVAALFSAYADRRDDSLRWLGEVLPVIEHAPAWSVNYPLLVFVGAWTLWELEETEHLETIERNLREKVIATDFRYMNTNGEYAMGMLAGLTGRFDEALDWFVRARVKIEEEGATPLRARVDFTEAQLYARRLAPGDSSRALVQLDAALQRFRPIGMTGWEQRAEALARELRTGA